MKSRQPSILNSPAALGFSPSVEDLMPFAGEQLAGIRALVQSDFGACMLVPLSGEARSDIAERLLRYLSYHAETRIEARSLRVLKELFR